MCLYPVVLLLCTHSIEILRHVPKGTPTRMVVTLLVYYSKQTNQQKQNETKPIKHQPKNRYKIVISVFHGILESSTSQSVILGTREILKTFSGNSHLKTDFTELLRHFHLFILSSGNFPEAAC